MLELNINGFIIVNKTIVAKTITLRTPSEDKNEESNFIIIHDGVVCYYQKTTTDWIRVALNLETNICDNSDDGVFDNTPTSICETIKFDPTIKYYHLHPALFNTVLTFPHKIIEQMLDAELTQYNRIIESQNNSATQNIVAVNVGPYIEPAQRTYKNDNLSYKGLENKANSASYLLKEAYFLFSDQKDYKKTIAQCSVPELNFLMYVLSDDTTNNLKNNIVRDFYAHIPSVEKSAEGYVQKMQDFKSAYRDAITERINLIKNLNISENADIEIAILKSRPRSELVLACKQPGFLTAKRLSEILAFIPEEEWLNFIEEAELHDLPAIMMLPNKKHFLEILLFIPKARWFKVFELPGVKRAFCDAYTTQGYFGGCTFRAGYVPVGGLLLEALDIIPKGQRWDYLSYESFSIMLTDNFLKQDSRLFYDFKLLLPNPYKSELMLLKSVADALNIWIDDSIKLSDWISDSICEDRLYNFLNLPVITEKINHYYNTYDDFMNLPKGILDISGQDGLLLVLAHPLIYAKLNEIFKTAIMIVSLLIQVDEEYGKLIELLFKDAPKNPKQIAIQIKEDINLELTKLLAVNDSDDEYIQKNIKPLTSQLLVTAFMEDQNQEFIATADDLSIDMLVLMMTHPSTEHWSKLNNLPKLNEKLTAWIPDKLGLINFLEKFNPDVRWALIAENTTIKNCFIKFALLEDKFRIDIFSPCSFLLSGGAQPTNQKNKLLELLDPKVGLLEHRKEVFKALTEAFALQDAMPNVSSSQHSQSTLFTPVVNPNDQPNRDFYKNLGEIIQAESRNENTVQMFDKQLKK